MSKIKQEEILISKNLGILKFEFKIIVISLIPPGTHEAPSLSNVLNVHPRNLSLGQT